MWKWIKHWQDWLMPELWPITRTGLQPLALHFAFEKAGLTLTDQAIPWNAEVVVVEVVARLDPTEIRQKADFKLRVPGCDPIMAESVRAEDPSGDRIRIVFRLMTPPRTTVAEVLFRNRRRGTLTLPIVTETEFFDQLRLSLPTVSVRVGDHSVACQTFVSSQCRGVIASGVLTSPMSLVPIHDLGLRVEFSNEKGELLATSPVSMASSQLAGRQALASVSLSNFPRRAGRWCVRWAIGERTLASHSIRAISARTFLKSLHLVDTRFVWQSPKGEVHLTRRLPAEAYQRLGPCFILVSSESGMAGLAKFRVDARRSDKEARQLSELEILVSDGPTMIAPGTLDAGDVAHIQSFDLRTSDRILGELSLSPVPEASFTNEGGFHAPADYAWSPQAEDTLHERLGHLLDK